MFIFNGFSALSIYAVGNGAPLTFLRLSVETLFQKKLILQIWTQKVVHPWNWLSLILMDGYGLWLLAAVLLWFTGTFLYGFNAMFGHFAVYKDWFNFKRKLTEVCIKLIRNNRFFALKSAWNCLDMLWYPTIC